MADVRHAAYTGTRNIYGDMEACAKSLVANSAVDVVHFLIEDAEFPHELPDIVRCHDVSGQTLFPQGGPNMTSKFSYMALMRMALCYIIPDARRVLSLDCDTFCRRDVTAIWELPVDGCYFSSTPEWHRSKNGLQYCNAGVTLFNLEMMRDGKADECIDALNRRRFTWVDQDVMSYLCQGHIHEMPTWFNSNHWTDKGADKNPAIIHYAGKKRNEWIREPDAEFWSKVTWDEAMARHAEIVKEHSCASS